MEQKKLTDEQLSAINELKAAIAKVGGLDVELFFEASEGRLFAINGDGNNGVVSENELMNEYGDDVERVKLDWNLTRCVFQPTCRNTDFDGELYLIKL